MRGFPGSLGVVVWVGHPHVSYFGSGQIWYLIFTVQQILFRLERWPLLPGVSIESGGLTISDF